MKKLLIVLLVLSGFYTKAQLPLSTIGEVFNFQVGDTFELKWQDYCGFSAPSQHTEYDRTVILSKSVLNNVYVYEEQHRYCSVYYGMDGNGNYYPIRNCRLDTLLSVYGPLDTTILYFVGEDTATWWSDGFNYHIDTAYTDATKAGIKISRHAGYGSLSSIDESSWGDGVGLVSKYYFESGAPGEVQECKDLIYFHKANGQQWGAPYVLPVGVDDLKVDFSIKVSPNPVEDHFQINAEHPVTFTLYNTSGQQVLSQKVDGFSTFNRKGLPAGIYYWLAESEGVKAGSGKLIFR